MRKCKVAGLLALELVVAEELVRDKEPRARYLAWEHVAHVLRETRSEGGEANRLLSCRPETSHLLVLCLEGRMSSQSLCYLSPCW